MTDRVRNDEPDWGPGPGPFGTAGRASSNHVDTSDGVWFVHEGEWCFRPHTISNRAANSIVRPDSEIEQRERKIKFQQDLEASSREAIVPFGVSEAEQRRMDGLEAIPNRVPRNCPHCQRPDDQHIDGRCPEGATGFVLPEVIEDAIAERERDQEIEAAQVEGHAMTDRVQCPGWGVDGHICPECDPEMFEPASSNRAACPDCGGRGIGCEGCGGLGWVVLTDAKCGAKLAGFECDLPKNHPHYHVHRRAIPNRAQEEHEAKLRRREQGARDAGAGRATRNRVQEILDAMPEHPLHYPCGEYCDGWQAAKKWIRERL